MIPVVDGHNDALLRVWRNGTSLAERDENGHVDVPRMREGGLAAGFFAVFVPDRDEAPANRRAEARATPDGYEVPQEGHLPFARATRIADGLVQLLERAPLLLVRDVADLEHCIGGGALGAILHLEGAEPIDPGLANLDAWVERGLRSLGLVWSRPNAFGHGVPFRFPGTPDTGPGLTREGRALVRRCNELGVLVDLAHLNARGFDDVAHLSTAPLVVSHAGAHALTPIPRNVTNAQLDAVRDSGGLVGITFGVTMTRADAALDPDTPLEVILDHVEHLAGRMGVAHVAIGSDFDGCVTPAALADATRVPALLDGLAARGWSDDDLRALAHGNWLRVLRETWR